MSDHLQQSFDRAQRQYDAQMPDEPRMKECPNCEGAGTVEIEAHDGVREMPCRVCDGDGEVEQTADDAIDREADAADHLNQIEKDGQ
jgi:RecJ-like exonuclease